MIPNINLSFLAILKILDFRSISFWFDVTSADRAFLYTRKIICFHWRNFYSNYVCTSDQTVCGVCTDFDTKQWLLRFALGPEFTQNKMRFLRIFRNSLGSGTLLQNKNDGSFTFLQGLWFPWIYGFPVDAMYIRHQVGKLICIFMGRLMAACVMLAAASRKLAFWMILLTWEVCYHQ